MYKKMTNKIIAIIAVLGCVLGIIGIFRPTISSSSFGSTVPSTGLLIENYDPYVRSAGGITTGLPILDTSDLTVKGGSLVVTSSNIATSTVVAGCFQFYATSTATSLIFQASTTPGAMYSQYGSCPNI